MVDSHNASLPNPRVGMVHYINTVKIPVSFAFKPFWVNVTGNVHLLLLAMTTDFS